MQRLTVLLAVIVLGVPLIAGCESGRPPMGSVSGTVTHQGKPIPEGTIIFEIAGARPATGKIVDGKITEVTTFDPNDGVCVGSAKIAVFAVEGGSEGGDAVMANPGDVSDDASNYMGMNAKSLIPPHYNDPASSGLSFEIKEGDNVVTLDLKD